MKNNDYDYNFNPAAVFAAITQDWMGWHERTNSSKYIIGLSGGKDSAVVAALAIKIFGAENVYGIYMPNNFSDSDWRDIEKLCDAIGFRRRQLFCYDISEAYNSIIGILDKVIETSDDTKINLPARLRMSILYAYAQSLDAKVLNTSNLSENIIGYSTLYGDHAGSYAPIATLTVTEVIKLGEWLGLPAALVHKKPADGLCGKTDEERLGFTYETLDNWIRYDERPRSIELQNKICERFIKNKFKMDLIRIPNPYLRYKIYYPTMSKDISF